MYNYVPILRWKKAEQNALCKLGHVENLIPLIEVIPKNFYKVKDIKKAKTKIPLSVNTVLHDIAEELVELWGDSPIYFDFLNLSPSLKTNNNQELITGFLEETQIRHLSVIPVIGLSRSSKFQEAIIDIVKKTNQELCFRILLSDIEKNDFVDSLDNLLSQLKVKRSLVNFIIDFQLITKESPEYLEIYQKIPYINRWKSLAFVGGSFPIDLSKLDWGDDHKLPRMEWKNWSSGIKNNQMNIRSPDYGDYTIQHPFYEEKLEFFQPSASIRYTTEQYWLVMRGRKPKNSNDFKQYPAFAKTLIKRPDYSGKNFSFGDKYIYEKSMLNLNQQKNLKTGNPATWLCAGINHHMSLVLEQIAN